MHLIQLSSELGQEVVSAEAVTVRQGMLLTDVTGFSVVNKLEMQTV